MSASTKYNLGAPYPETADIETSSDAYAARFAGPAGIWMLSVQERATLDLLRETGARSILDVGGGHGQLAHPLCREKYDVTVLGSAASCAARVQSLIDAGACRFVVGNVIGIPFPDRSFDAAICFRLVMHCQQWPQLIKELCRVARQTVIIDFPTRRSLNAISPLLFSAKKKIEGNTRAWRLFGIRQLDAEFERHGFRRSAYRGQFFFPMVLHRILKRPTLSAMLEGTTRALGLNRLFGSPVIVRMTRQGGSS